MTEEKMQFVSRLIELVDQLRYPEHGRQTQLAGYYKVTQGAARKWFAGEAMPSYEICIDLCKRAHVHYEWLMTGRGPKEMGTQKASAPEEEDDSSIDIGALKDAITAAIEIDKQGKLKLASEKMAILIAFWYEDFREKGHHNPTLAEANRILRLVA